MFDFTGLTITPLTIIAPPQSGAEAFNYFFTLVLMFGMFSWGIGMLASIISKS